MSETILIYGNSGSGKTHSLQFLDPKTTFIVDADLKGLNWRGWKGQYNADNKNYLRTSSVQTINKILDKVNTEESAKHIKTVVIDTINGIMVDAEFDRMKEKGYDKWVELSQDVYQLVNKCLGLRFDLDIIFTGHSEDAGDEIKPDIRLKTSGRKLQKIVLESKFSIVLQAKCKPNNDKNEYIFETQANFSTAKSPSGMFEDREIPNNMQFVIDKVREYNEFPL